MTIEHIIRQINKDLVPQFEEKLRVHLQGQSREWLIEQIIRLTLDAHSLQENDRKQSQAAKEKRRAELMKRISAISLDEKILKNFLTRYQKTTRESLIAEGFLKQNAPTKGTALITSAYRTPKGEELLTLAKDMLFDLLFGDESTDTTFHRIQREMLTLTLPASKAWVIDFMKATTELSALGTWQDPDSVSNDSRAENVILEVEFGEIEGEFIGQGIITALGLINNLEVNEQILYGRMINVEQSTLIA